MTDAGKNSIVFGYAFTYAAGVSAFKAISNFTVFSHSVDPNKAYSIAFLAGFHFVSLLGYALGFVVLAATLDSLTKRSPQPMNALNLGLAAFATVDLLQQVFFLNAYTSHAVMKP